MQVCMLAYTFYESDNRVRRYAEALAKRGDEVDAIALRRAGQARFEVIRGVRVHRIQKRVRNEQHPVGYLIKLLMFLLRSAWTVTRFHWRAHYDLIHVHSVPDFAVFATAIPRLMGARVILDIHDIVPEFYAAKFHITPRSIVFRLLVLMERLSAWYSHHVIIANHIWHERLRQRSVRPEKCTVILNYPDREIFYPRERKEAERDVFVMCYPGTLNWHQGLDRAIRAVAILREKAPNLRLRIIGDGPALETLKAMIRLERLEDRVLITGSVPIEEVAETLASVDLGIVPKRKDSFGNEAFSTKILEFMAMGVPVLAANTRIDQYYFNENLLQFFDSDSVDDLAAKITSLMRDPARRAALCRRASEFIRLNNWDVKGGEYFELVDRLVRSKKGATVAETLTT